MADDVEVETWPHEPGALTGSCALGQCGWCYGYIKPVENGVKRLCQHRCHDNGRGNPRNYECAVKWALAAEQTREPAYDEEAVLARFEAWLQDALDEG